MKVLISHEEIVLMCEKIGKKLSDKFRGEVPILACVLKGACPFYAELVKHINIDVEFDFVQASSYMGGLTSSGNINIKKDLESNISNRHLVLVEDIIDTGLTMKTLVEKLKERNPKSITVVSMLDKPSRRKVDFRPDFIGKEIDDLFVVGFGLDFDEKLRNLKDVYVYNEG